MHPTTNPRSTFGATQPHAEQAWQPEQTEQPLTAPDEAPAQPLGLQMWPTDADSATAAMPEPLLAQPLHTPELPPLEQALAQTGQEDGYGYSYSPAPAFDALTQPWEQSAQSAPSADARNAINSSDYSLVSDRLQALAQEQAQELQAQASERAAASNLRQAIPATTVPSVPQAGVVDALPAQATHAGQMPSRAQPLQEVAEAAAVEGAMAPAAQPAASTADQAVSGVASAGAEVPTTSVAAAAGDTAQAAGMDLAASAAPSGPMFSWQTGAAMPKITKSGPRPDDSILVDGSPDMWMVPAQVERATKGMFPPAPVRLKNGFHRRSNQGYGVAHIEAEHAAEISALGLTVPQYVQRILGGATKVYDPGNGRLYVVNERFAGKHQAIIELRDDGDHYSVVTAFARRPEGKVVWSGRSSSAGLPGAHTGVQAPLATGKTESFDPTPAFGSSADPTAYRDNGELQAETPKPSPSSRIAGQTGEILPEGGDPSYSKAMSADLASATVATQNQPAMATIESVQAAVDHLAGAGGRLRMGRGGVVVTTADRIKTDWEPLVGRVAIASEDAGRAQGFYDPQSKTVFLIADHIKAGHEVAVAAHELMHKHGQAVLGVEGWNQLHETIGGWANAAEGSVERQVYDEAVARVEASRPAGANEGLYATQELFPYAVQIAVEMGVQPNALRPANTVVGWLAQVRGTLRRVWNKIATQKGDFNSMDLVNLAFGIAQRENPAHAGELDAVTTAQLQDAAAALKEISEAGDLFALPRSSATTVEAIAADHDPGIKVEVTTQGDETMRTLTMPDGTHATITTREPTRDEFYGMDHDTGAWIKDRPGEKSPPVASRSDVWGDLSRLEPGQTGGVFYNIAATYAHNTGRILIGDPSGVNDLAMRRLPEQMLSNALKFGTTEHLAPHPRQVAGDAALGVPPLRWVYGDHAGNIQRLVDVNEAALENESPNAKYITYDLQSGTFRDSRTGALLEGGGIDAAAHARGDAGVLAKPSAGWRTLARGAVFRALLGRGANTREDAGPGPGAASRSGRGEVLDALVRQPDQLAPARDGGLEQGSRLLAGLARQRDRLASSEREDRIFYSRSTAVGPARSAAAQRPVQGTQSRITALRPAALRTAVDPRMADNPMRDQAGEGFFFSGLQPERFGGLFAGLRD